MISDYQRLIGFENCSPVLWDLVYIDCTWHIFHRKYNPHAHLPSNYLWQVGRPLTHDHHSLFSRRWTYIRKVLLPGRVAPRRLRWQFWTSYSSTVWPVTAHGSSMTIHCSSNWQTLGSVVVCRVREEVLHLALSFHRVITPFSERQPHINHFFCGTYINLIGVVHNRCAKKRKTWSVPAENDGVLTCCEVELIIWTSWWTRRYPHHPGTKHMGFSP